MSYAPEQFHRDGWSLPSATGDARGLYNPLQFVVRLHPDLHEQLQGLPPGVNPPRSFGATQALALSTYYHETIHWWQHVGSTLGLFLSLAYPAQTHINYAYLKKVLELIGPVKSLKTFQVAPPRSITNEAEQQLNIVLNNWHDIEFCRCLTLLPEYARAYLRDRYFECIGHSFHITWASALQLVGAAADPTHSFLPDPRAWDEPFFAPPRRTCSGLLLSVAAVFAVPWRAGDI
jgi:hypothetical protein